MKNYYLLLLFLLPFIGKANSSIYSDRDFTQLSGLYELIEEEADNTAEFKYIFFAHNYTAYFSNAKVSYVALSSKKGSEMVEGLRMDVQYLEPSSQSKLVGERALQKASIRKSINGRMYRLHKVKSLRMQELYPKIDLEFFVNDEGGLQYLYDLKEGADPNKIEVKYIGSESLGIAENGDLQVQTAIGTMTESSPITLKGSREKVVKSAYVLNKDNTVGFRIAKHKANKEYIIDPYIRWSTFYGGSGGERVSDLDVDDSSYTYVTGYTESTDFPTSPGAFQTSLSNQQDIAIVKLDSTGNLVWSTYFGGDRRDEGKDVSVASDGKIYITGITESTDFPVSDNSIYKGGIDAILIALNPDGSRIRSSLIGGASDDRGESIIVDGNSLYIGGSTSSNDFPTAAPGSLAGDLDAFLLKTDLAGNISFSAFYGGLSAEEAFGLAMDSLGNLIIAGRTSSNNLPVSATAFQTSNNGLDDAFIAKYSPTGSLLWSTYYGGSEFDQILDIGIDNYNNIYFSGITASMDLAFPTTLPSDTNYNTTYGGGEFDGLVGKVNMAGQFMWSSYYGASDHDEFQGIGVSNYQSIILSGKTYSSDFEVTDNAHQPALAGGSDAVIVQFDSTGMLIYSSFLGGTEDEDVVASTFGKNNRYFYTAGNTKSAGFPTTSGTAQPTYAGNNDMFIVSFCALAPNNTIANTGEDTIFVCPGTPLPFLDGSTPTGGSGQYSFQYQSAVPGGSFVNIPGATSEDYQVVNISTTTIFRRIVYDGECESISPEVTIFFTQPAIADFSTDASCDAVADSVHFTDLSQASGAVITSYTYYFGDGDSSNSPNPVHLYDSAGAYTAMLIIHTNQGCVDTSIQVVDVSYTPVAAFSSINPCANQPMYFSNQSSIQAGAVDYFWSFGDDSSSTEVNPIHYYADTGTYVVQLIATSGFCADTVEQTVVIKQSPVADFSFDITCPDTAVVFTNLSGIASGSIVGYEWDFGDNTSSTQTNPTKVFPRNGPFTVSLVATANTGCTDTLSKEVNPDSVLIADFSYINNCLNLPTQFNSLSTSTNGTIVDYQWDFDDGFQSTLKNPTHTFTSTGSYDVRLIVTSDIGCVDTIIQTVVVNPPPVANFSVLDECPRTTLAITNLSVSSATNVQYIWDFGDGTGSSDFEPQKSYDTSGVFTIMLTVINDNGCVKDTSMDVTIYPEPVSDFDFGPVSCLDSVINFTNNSSISGGSIVQYRWTFGDGGNSVLNSPSHTYTEPGNYDVSLIATSDNGCSDTIVQELTINPQPFASFSYSSACSGVDILFSNSSLSTISSPDYFWDFGDGTSSTDFEPVKSFASEGSYTVSLTVNENGCTDDTSIVIEVLPDPVADFTYSSLNCLNAPLSFSNVSSISSGNIDSYFWDFGDGNTSTDENPVHSYAASGNYTVSLVATSNSGCRDTISKNLLLTVSPIANFNTNFTCVGQDVQFSDSTITQDSIISYHYDFGDGSTSSQKDPMNIYQNAGNYTVVYTVVSLQGCTSSVSKSIYIAPPPFVDAGVDRTYISGSAGGIQLNASASGSGSFRWSPSEGLNTDNNPNPLANPDTTTTYTVTFTNEFGCIATDVITIEVLSQFKIPTAFSPNNDGYNDFFEISKIECFPDHEIRIYDQWGALLYSNVGSYHYNPWDGTHDGEPMPFASYFYVLELNTDNLNGLCNDMTSPPTKKIYKGTVTILR